MSLRIGDRERAEAYGTIGLTKPGRREAGAMPVSQGTAADRATDGRPALRRRTLDGNLLRTWIFVMIAVESDASHTVLYR